MKAPRRGKPPRHLADLTSDERKAVAEELGQPAFRVKQVAHHYFARHERDPQAMTDLPAANRDVIASALLPELLHPLRVLEADGGATRKTLWRLFDGALVESVLMRYPDRATLCVSSQAGCGMACPFCATGQGGLQRNMSTGEIIDQVVEAAALMERGVIPGGQGRLSNIVFMGMGEPMANYGAVMAAIRQMVSPDGLGLSARNVTLSTVGLVPRIRQLTGEGIPVTLAVSLHAPDDELRDELVPINTRWKLDEVLDAARGYFEATGRRVSIEYAMMRDINDQGWRSDLLGNKLLAHGGAKGPAWVHVNLIPLNPIKRAPDHVGAHYTRSRTEDMDEFVRRLETKGISTTVRDTRGQDIDAACGQLAAAGD
jgi:23S rRNA (adenine2503-C2)-methyltransferase